jgi:uncharacterized protein YxeA
MKKLLLTLVAMITLIFTAIDANAQYTSGSTNSSTTYVRGYTRSDGTYVHGYTRSSRNSSNHDNYSTSGNVNPYTGKSGNRARDYSSRAYNYGSGHTIHTGPRGGQYYINSHGKKTYVPKRR